MRCNGDKRFQLTIQINREKLARSCNSHRGLESERRTEEKKDRGRDCFAKFVSERNRYTYSCNDRRSGAFKLKLRIKFECRLNAVRSARKFIRLEVRHWRRSTPLSSKITRPQWRITSSPASTQGPFVCQYLHFKQSIRHRRLRLNLTNAVRARPATLLRHRGGGSAGFNALLHGSTNSFRTLLSDYTGI